MLYDLILLLGLYIGGILTGIVIIRYGIGLGSKMHVKAKNDISLGETITDKQIIEEFTK